VGEFPYKTVQVGNFDSFLQFPLFILDLACYNIDNCAKYISKGGILLSLFRKLFKPKDPNSRAFREQRAAELHGQAIRYVTERRGDVDEVVGRGGCLSVRNGEFLLLTSGDILMRARVEELQAAYLMSGDGVVLTAPNIEEGGKERTYIAHFVYYRK